MKFLKFLLLVSVVFFACNAGEQKQEEVEKSDKVEEIEKISVEQEFFNYFKQFEGKKFFGKQTFIADDVDSWDGLELEMHVRQWTDSVIYIPLRVGDNTSRTWMVIMEDDNKLRYRHDHRHEDGTPEDLSMYGGYSNNFGTPFKQIFPADEFTCDMLPRICDNEWTAEFSEDLSTYLYSLRKEGKLIITVEFDLTIE